MAGPLPSETTVTSPPVYLDDTVFPPDATQGAIHSVLEELNRAMVWPSMNSAHEGYGVLLEEMDELWDQVKVNQKRRDIEKMRAEAIQVAAMAIRFAVDVCNETVGRR